MVGNRLHSVAIDPTQTGRREEKFVTAPESYLQREQVVAEVEIALRQLLKFLDFDRGNFVEFTDGGVTVPAQG